MIKKSQAWGIDATIAVTIFIIGIFIFYIYSINTENKSTIEKLSYDGKVVMDSILSDGYPLNWDSTSVIKIGILSQNKINEAKLQNFYNLEYSKTRKLFNTRYNYYFFLSENMYINGNVVEGIGNQGANKNLIKITRFTIYRNKPVTAYLYIWE